MPVERALLLLADIVGYTRFMKLHRSTSPTHRTSPADCSKLSWTPPPSSSASRSRATPRSSIERTPPEGTTLQRSPRSHWR